MRAITRIDKEYEYISKISRVILWKGVSVYPSLPALSIVAKTTRNKKKFMFTAQIVSSRDDESSLMEDASSGECEDEHARKSVRLAPSLVFKTLSQNNILIFS